MKHLSPRPQFSECRKGQAQGVAERTRCQVVKWPFGFMPGEVRASATLTQASGTKLGRGQSRGTFLAEAGPKEAWDSCGLAPDTVSGGARGEAALVLVTRTPLAQSDTAQEATHGGTRRGGFVH